ncbi:MAG: 16S rRNA (cytidine(1402)-2'-O)-methyltransferase [Peptococcaceae bacterium]|jgi:16S rRNA (cytidine1402-2'-O)-methyltransferase|nr:16S rRNA (cytidine(1402)-2'-O)-methyltransferase [Peptococcaceae bacterium]
MNQPGVLYLVGTPIGNLEDITLRAIRTLGEADLIAAEDTRHTLRLLNHLQIKKPLISYFEHNKRSRAPVILRALAEGKNVALVSDAGMPGLSDPGADMAAECLEAGFRVAVVPGPSAAVAALAGSGLDMSGFYFGGFFPRQKKERRACLEAMAGFPKTMVFYESPRRLLETLRWMEEAWGDRYCCVARELTKIHEEWRRGSLSHVREIFAGREGIRGEITLLVQGADAGAARTEADAEAPADTEAPREDAARECLRRFLDQGMTTKDAVTETAQTLGMPRRLIYSIAHRGGEEILNRESTETGETVRK